MGRRWGPLPCPGDVLAAGMSQAPAGKAEEGRIRPFPWQGGCRLQSSPGGRGPQRSPPHPSFPAH